MALQAVDDQLFDDVVDNGEQRHAHDHAHKAPQAAEQQDGEQHPEAGKAGGVAQNFGSDDVAVQLLQYQHKQHEPQRLDGVLDEDEQGGGDGTDEGAEEGDDVGYTDDHRHQQRTGELEDQTADIAQHADDGRVHDLAVDEAAEHPVCVFHFLGDQLRPAGADDAVQHQLALLDEPLAAGQHIHRHDDADDQVLGHRHHVQHADGCAAYDVLHGGQQGVLDPRVKIGIQGSVGRIEQLHDLFVVFNKLQMVCPVHEPCNVGLRGVVQGRHAGDQLRHDHHDQRIHQQKSEQDGECHGQRVDQTVHLFRDEPAQKVFDAVAYRLEQIGNDGTVDKGHQDAGQGRDS